MEVVQHIQSTDLSLVISASPPKRLTLTWEQVPDNYVISVFIIEHLERIIRGQAGKEQVALLIHTYPGISIEKGLQKILQRPDAYEHISAVAIVLPSTTSRLSLNLFSQIQSIPTPIRAFANKRQAEIWLKKKVNP